MSILDRLLGPPRSPSREAIRSAVRWSLVDEDGATVVRLTDVHMDRPVHDLSTFDSGRFDVADGRWEFHIEFDDVVKPDVLAAGDGTMALRMDMSGHRLTWPHLMTVTLYGNSNATVAADLIQTKAGWTAERLP